LNQVSSRETFIGGPIHFFLRLLGVHCLKLEQKGNEEAPFPLSAFTRSLPAGLT
jgi:hypothetical protein